MTGTEFYNYTLRKFKRTDKETEFYEAVNDIIADMSMRFESEDYITETSITGITVSGDYQLNLPSDYGHIVGDISLFDTTEDREYPSLKKISKSEFNDKYADRLLSTSNQNQSQPIHYCLFGSVIEVGPVPDKTTYEYKITYTTDNLTEVTSSTDPVPFTDTDQRNILRNGVLMELHYGMESYEEGSIYERLYLRGLDLLRINDRENTASEGMVAYHGI